VSRRHTTIIATIRKLGQIWIQCHHRRLATIIPTISNVRDSTHPAGESAKWPRGGSRQPVCREEVIGRQRTDQSGNQEATSCRSFRGELRDQFRVAVPFTGRRGDPAGSDDASLSRFRDGAGRVNDCIDFRLSEAPSSNMRTLRCPSYDNAFPLTAMARTSSYECDRSPHAR